MNITKHFLERWVERVLYIEDNKEVKEYVVKNDEILRSNIDTTFNHSDYIYTGQIGDNITRNYYIKDDIILVANTTNDALITVYRIDLGLTKELNKTVIKGLIDELTKLKAEKEEIDHEVNNEIDVINADIDGISDNIKILESQIEMLRAEKKFREEEIKQIKSKSINIGLEMKKYALTLVNSKDYRKDLTNIK